jgi:hypothetical protein
VGRERRPGEALEAFVERQIREAQAAGELDDVAAKGQPLPFVDKPHDPMAWWKRKLEQEKLSLLPDSLQVLREAEAALAEVARIGSEPRVRARLESLNERIRQVNRTATGGPPTTLAPLDVEAVLARWRAARRR